MANMKIRAAALRALEDEFGRLTTEALVQAARDRKHPLHEEFDWNDKSAAHTARLAKAGEIIRSVRVQVRTSTKSLLAPSYVQDPVAAAERRAGYVSMARLRTEEDSKHEALLVELGRVQAMMERCREIAAALELDDEMEAAMEGVRTLVSRARMGRSIPEGLSLS